MRPHRRARVRTLVQLVADYSSIRPQHELLARIVKSKLSKAIQRLGLSVDSVTYRTKSPDSLKEKILRPGKRYKNPLKEITDLSGVRVMTHFRSDVATVGSIVRELFVVDEARSKDFEAASSPKTFGYQSVHFVVSLKARDVPKKGRSLRGLKCEVQVRTILQHAWAATAHGLLYKPPSRVPRLIQRRFYALSGLLETADNELETFRDPEVRLKIQIRERILRKDLNIVLDPISLPIYLWEKRFRNRRGGPIGGKVAYELVEEAQAVGMKRIADLDHALAYFPTKDWIALLHRLGYKQRFGIGQVRDVLRYSDPDAYLAFVRRRRPGWAIPSIRALCAGLKALKVESVGSASGESR